MSLRWGLALAVLLLSSVTRADTIEEAKGHFRHGTAAYALGKFDEAAREYEAAYELAPDPALLYNAAQAHRLGGNDKRALMLYQSYLRIYPEQSNTDEVRRHVEDLKAAIEKQSAPPTTLQQPQPPLQPAPPSVVTTPNVVAATAPEHKSAAKNPWLWVGVGVGVVAIAVGVGLGVALGGPSDPKPTLGAVTY